jgi:hypothetical protein
MQWNQLIKRLNSIGVGEYHYTTNFGGHFLYRNEKIILRATSENNLYAMIYAYLLGMEHKLI